MSNYIDDPMGHVWRLTESEEIDNEAYNVGDYHYGPRCVVCGYGFCLRCREMPSVSCPGHIAYKDHDADLSETPKIIKEGTNDN